MMKDVIKRQDVSSFLFTRFFIAAVAMLLLRPSVVKHLSSDMLGKGAMAGIFLGSGFILQTFGLEKSSAAITGFITGLYVVATPIIASLLLKHQISRRTWGSVAIATIGLALLSIHGWAIGTGELLLLGCAIAFACHIICLAHWSGNLDTYAFTFVQISTSAIMCGIASLFHGYQFPPDIKVWEVAIYCALFATVAAFFIQTWSQARIAPTKVAVILTMEIVFAATFAIIFGGESLSTQVAIGGFLVVLAIYSIVLEDA